MSMVWLTEALARKREANGLAKKPTDIGSKLNPFSTLCCAQPGAATKAVGRPGAGEYSLEPARCQGN